MVSGPEKEEDLFYKWIRGCREILALTREQQEAVAAGDFARLESLLSRRGEVMARLGDLRDEGLEEGRLILRGNWEEVARLLEEIAYLDELVQTALAARLQSVRGDMERLNKWRQAVRAYGGPEGMVDPGVKT